MNDYFESLLHSFSSIVFFSSFSVHAFCSFAQIKSLNFNAFELSFLVAKPEKLARLPGN